jgi:hypothetical protein
MVYNASALLPLVLGLITSSLSGRVTLLISPFERLPRTAQYFH